MGYLSNTITDKCPACGEKGQIDESKNNKDSYYNTYVCPNLKCGVVEFIRRKN